MICCIKLPTWNQFITFQVKCPNLPILINTSTDYQTRISHSRSGCFIRNTIQISNTDKEAIHTIAEIISTKPQTAIVYTGEDGQSRPVVIENKSKTDWAVGDYLRIYCDAYGTYSAMPWLIARYTYQ